MQLGSEGLAGSVSVGSSPTPDQQPGDIAVEGPALSLPCCHPPESLNSSLDPADGLRDHIQSSLAHGQGSDYVHPGVYGHPGLTRISSSSRAPTNICMNVFREGYLHECIQNGQTFMNTS